MGDGGDLLSIDGQTGLGANSVSAIRNLGETAMTTTYRKTATIEATQWFKMGDHPAVVLKSDPNRYADEGIPWCPTMEGGHVVTPGDWIATGIKGEHWPIKPDVFAETYTPVDTALSTPATEPQGYVEGLEAVLEIVADGHSKDYTDNCILARQALAARPAPQPAADTRVDLINRMDAVQACQVGPSDEWAKATKDGYNQAATDCAFNILKIKPAIIGNATTATSDKIAEAARVLDLDPVQVGKISNYYGGLWIKATDGVPYWSIEDYSGDTWDVCPIPVFIALRALAGQGETP